MNGWMNESMNGWTDGIAGNHKIENTKKDQYRNYVESSHQLNCNVV